MQPSPLTGESSHLTAAKKKTELRRRALEQRDQLAPAKAAAASHQACMRFVLPMLEAHEGPVAAYGAMPNELSLETLLEACWLQGRALALPRIETGTRVLSFRLVRRAEELEPGPFGILEPNAKAPLLPLDSIQLIFVPGLAFDRSGERLGFGKGYYDHTLAQCAAAHRVGCCFSDQLVSALPSESFDQKMHQVITELELITCPPLEG